MNQQRRRSSIQSVARMEIDYYSYSLVPATVDNFILAVTQPIPFASLPARFARFSRSSRFRVWNLHTGHMDCTSQAYAHLKLDSVGTMFPTWLLTHKKKGLKNFIPCTNYAPRSFTSIHFKTLLRRQKSESQNARARMHGALFRISKMNSARLRNTSVLDLRVYSCSTNVRCWCVSDWKPKTCERMPACVARFSTGVHMCHATYRVYTTVPLPALSIPRTQTGLHCVCIHTNRDPA